MPSTPPPSASAPAPPTQATAPTSGSTSLLSAVSRVLALRPPPSPSSSVPAPSTSSTGAGPYHLDRTRLTLDEFTADSFPPIDEGKLEAIWPSPGFDAVRSNVLAALDDMKLNFDLDPKRLGQRSDVHSGYQAIALVLSRLEVGAPSEEVHSAALEGRDPQPHDAASHGPRGVTETKPNPTVPPAGARRYEPHDLLKAIERRDTDTILQIRDADFDLLLDLSAAGAGGAVSSSTAAAGTTNAHAQTPLGYAISLGPGWEGVAVVLVGALSKWVNMLPDDEDQQEQAKGKAPTRTELDQKTVARLRKVRVNLKMAIEYSVVREQTRLVASYVQVLVMSEGTPFLLNTISSLQHTLLSPSPSSSVVGQARSSILQFVTDALRHKANRVAAVQDYVANATLDLVLMAVWDLVKLSSSEIPDQEAEGDPHPHPDLAVQIPLYYFARDDRVTRCFEERVGRLNIFLDGKEQQEAKRGKRNPTVWKIARNVVHALDQGSRRKASDERLKVVAGVLQR
ncbi:hypothetical protein ACQY0O_000710 [Thecaphora frezii]